MAETGAANVREDADSDEETGHEENTEVLRPGELAERPVGAGDVRQALWKLLPASLQRSRVDPGRAGCLGVVLAAVVITAVLGAMVWPSEPATAPVPALPSVRPVVATPSTEEKPPDLVVSVVGRVHEPGLVTLPPDARVADALEAAGGALPETELMALNLARPLTDGEQLYVGVPVPPQARATKAISGDGDTPDKIDLNSAGKSRLEELPGVGPVTAERILQWRTEHGGFDSVQQLRQVDGIGEVKFSRLRDLVRV